MNKIPFRRFIIMFLFANKSVDFIVEKLKAFGFYATVGVVTTIFDDVKAILPDNIVEELDLGIPLDINADINVQWLKHYGIYEFYDYLIRKNNTFEKDERPEYFKWCEDCFWIHTYNDVVALTNIFLYNNEPLDSISKIINFKYRKKIGVDALALYKSVFWDCDNIDAMKALHWCTTLRNNALILHTLRSGGADLSRHIKSNPEEYDGCDVPVTFHDNNYIKWKIGYNEVPVPTIEQFMNKVVTDSMYKYQETMTMEQSVIREDITGTVMTDTGPMPIETKKIKYRNVEEMRVDLARKWVDLADRAYKNLPKTEFGKNKEFLEKMQAIELDFDEDRDKLVAVNDVVGMFDDIKGDFTGFTKDGV